ncbi:hypothetical protein C7E12_20790, partial [Stenotrophomonas maltophilia]
ATREELRKAIDQAHAAGLQIIGQQIEDPQAAAAMWVGGVDYIQGNMVQSAGSDLNFGHARGAAQGDRSGPCRRAADHRPADRGSAGCGG